MFTIDETLLKKIFHFKTKSQPENRKLVAYSICKLNSFVSWNFDLEIQKISARTSLGFKSNPACKNEWSMSVRLARKVIIFGKNGTLF